jgi:hypothetical protein
MSESTMMYMFEPEKLKTQSMKRYTFPAKTPTVIGIPLPLNPGEAATQQSVQRTNIAAGQETVAANDTVTSASTETLTAPAATTVVANNTRDDCFTGIFPGQTSREAVLAQMGEPTATQSNGSYEALQYATRRKGQYHTIVLLDQILVRVSEVMDEDYLLTWSAVRAKYGEPAYTSFSDYIEGNRYYAFPEKGIRVIANPYWDMVFVQECYETMSLDQYLNAYGDSLLQEDPFTK